MADLLAPDQLGIGVRGGAKTDVDFGRFYLHNLDPQQVFMKLDFENAFNMFHRDKLLAAIQMMVHDFVLFVYSPIFLLCLSFGETRSYSLKKESRKVTLLPPLLFCLSVFLFLSLLKSEFHVFYFDDILLGVDVNDYLHNFR